MAQLDFPLKPPTSNPCLSGFSSAHCIPLAALMSLHHKKEKIEGSGECGVAKWGNFQREKFSRQLARGRGHAAECTRKKMQGQEGQSEIQCTQMQLSPRLSRFPPCPLAGPTLSWGGLGGERGRHLAATEIERAPFDSRDERKCLEIRLRIRSEEGSAAVASRLLFFSS